MYKRQKMSSDACKGVGGGGSCPVLDFSDLAGKESTEEGKKALYARKGRLKEAAAERKREQTPIPQQRDLRTFMYIPGLYYLAVSVHLHF